MIRERAGPAAFARPGRCLTLALALALALAALAGGDTRAETVDLRVEVRRVEVARAQRVLKVRHDDLVRIEWLSDRAVVIHLEGYDISVAAEPGKPEIMEFKAFATGRFPVHAHEVDPEGGPARHGHHTRPLLRLEVHPK